MRTKRTHGGAAIEFAFMAPFMVSLIIGTMTYGTELIKEMELQQIARDTASMTARGVNFNAAANQAIVARLGQELNWPVTGLVATSPGVVYVSTIEYLDATCNGRSPVCTNAGYWVYLNSVAFGNTNFRKSNIGAPASCLTGCLDTSQDNGALTSDATLNNTGARVMTFSLLSPSTGTAGFQPGQPTFLIEAAANISFWGTPGYAYALF